ncbi:MAG: agmatine deiminase family protein [bacterium]
MRSLGTILVLFAVAQGCGGRDGEGAPGAASAGTGDRREATAPVTAAEVFMPGDFDAQESLLMGGTMLAGLFPGVLVDIVRAVPRDVRVVMLVAADEEVGPIRRLLAASGLQGDAVDFLAAPILTMWTRDFGPITVLDGGGRKRLVDFAYRERRGNAVDDGVPRELAARLDLPLIECPLLLEGGDFLSNGWGLGVGSTRIIARNQHYLSLDPDAVIPRIGRTLGFESFQLLQPLAGETTGHLDMFCAFLRPDLVVVARIDPVLDPGNASRLDQAAATLEGMATRQGPLQVDRVTMPAAEDEVWRTYTNIVMANGVVLVPIYPDHCPDLDTEALELYRRLLPDRRVVGIDASGLITMRGALRCITMNIPAGSRRGAVDFSLPEPGPGP